MKKSIMRFDDVSGILNLIISVPESLTNYIIQGDEIELQFEDKQCNRLRDVKKIYEYIKESDPDTAVTEYLIRKIVYEGYVPYIQTGNKRLTTIEAVISYLEGKAAANGI